LDEHPHFLHKPEDEIKEPNPKPLNRAEIAEFLRVSPVTITDWMKKGLPYKRMEGRVYFIKEEVMEALPSFKHRKKTFIPVNKSDRVVN